MSIVLLQLVAGREETHNHFSIEGGLSNRLLCTILKPFYCSRGQYLEEAAIARAQTRDNRHFCRSNLYMNLGPSRATLR